MFVTGGRGSGLTTFGTRLLELRRKDGRTVHRLTGSPALTEIPFASVVALGAQISGLRDLSHSPLEMVGQIAGMSAGRTRTLFIDRAELIDAASAAALVQLTELGVFELICATSDRTELPDDLQRLAYEQGSTALFLPELTLEDTLLLLEDLLGAPCEASSAQRLLELAGGSPLLVRELAIDAHNREAIARHRGYLAIRTTWQPQSSRVARLLRDRMSAQPDALREVVELVAVVGELPREVAEILLRPQQIDLALSERLLNLVPRTGPEADRLVLGAGLAPETVVSTLGSSTLEALIERLRAEVSPELLTPNMRVQLAMNGRSLGLTVSLAQLTEDAETAAILRQFDAVLALTEGLSDNTAPRAGGEADGQLRMFRSEAFLETGVPETALRVLEPLIQTGDLDARLFAAYIEFSGLGRPDLMQARLAAHPGDAPEVAALRAILGARSGEHIAIETLQCHAEDERLSLSLRLSVAAQLVCEHSYLGNPRDAIEEYLRLRGGPLWQKSPPSQRGELMHTLFVAMQCDGAAERAYAALFEGIDWKHLSLDQATALAAAGLQRIEAGSASEASEFLAQASALITQRDPHQLAGFIAVLDSVAGVMLGDEARARASYAQFQAGSDTSGQVARLEARRLALATVQLLEGDEAGRATLGEMVAEADRRGHRHVRMRLLHEGWRLRLIDDVGELSEAAEGVQGQLAATLSRYGEAFGGVHCDEENECKNGQRNTGLAPDALNAVIAEHVEAGRMLYAAEAAARGAEQAKARGEWRRAAQLLDQCAAIAEPLTGVHTPSLRRARIESEILSEREYEVCLSAAEGLSNAEIAEEMFLSPRTVEGHLQRAYGKLGVTDRRMLLLPS